MTLIMWWWWWWPNDSGSSAEVEAVLDESISQTQREEVSSAVGRVAVIEQQTVAGGRQEHRRNVIRRHRRRTQTHELQVWVSAVEPRYDYVHLCVTDNTSHVTAACLLWTDGRPCSVQWRACWWVCVSLPGTTLQTLANFLCMLCTVKFKTMLNCVPVATVYATCFMSKTKQVAVAPTGRQQRFYTTTNAAITRLNSASTTQDEREAKRSPGQVSGVECIPGP